jgi:hypothetical protein
MLAILKKGGHTMTYGRSYGGTAAENYQRFFVPSIGGPMAEDLIEAARLQPASVCSTSHAARAS